jgi:hypothetical protein
LRTLAFALIATTLPNLALAVPSSPYLGEDALTFPNGRSLPARRTEVGVPPRSQAAWAELQAHLGTTWRADFDVVTGVPHQIYGGFVDAPGAIASAEAAQAYGLEVLARHGALLAPGAAVSDFVVASNDLTDGLRTVGFVQHHQGLLVEGGQLSFRFKKDRLFMIVSEAWPKVQVNLPKVLLAKEAAVAKAQAWLRSVHGQEGELRDFRGPLILAQTPEGPAVAFVATLRTRQPIGQFDVYVDAESGRPLARRQTLMFADGTVRINTPERWPGSTRIDAPASRLSLTACGRRARDRRAGARHVEHRRTDRGGRARTGPVGPRDQQREPDPGQRDVHPRSRGHVRLGSPLQRARGRAAHDVRRVGGRQGAHQAHRARDALARHEPARGERQPRGQLQRLLGRQHDQLLPRRQRLREHRPSARRHLPRVRARLSLPRDHQRRGHASTRALSEGAADYIAATITATRHGRGFFFDERPLRHIDPVNREARWPDDIARIPTRRASSSPARCGICARRSSRRSAKARASRRPTA